MPADVDVAPLPRLLGEGRQGALRRCQEPRQRHEGQPLARRAGEERLGARVGSKDVNNLTRARNVERRGEGGGDHGANVHPPNCPSQAEG